MKKLFVMSLCIIISSCFKTEIVQYETWNRNPVTKESGLQVNSIQAQNFKFDGGKFLSKYDETMWADTENYFSSFSDIKFEGNGPVFISFFNIDNEVSYCKGWKKGENTYDGIKWNIKIKKEAAQLGSLFFYMLISNEKVNFRIHLSKTYFLCYAQWFAMQVLRLLH